jgi:hypothetical protein
LLNGPTRRSNAANLLFVDQKLSIAQQMDANRLKSARLGIGRRGLCPDNL